MKTYKVLETLQVEKSKVFWHRISCKVFWKCYLVMKTYKVLETLQVEKPSVFFTSDFLQGFLKVLFGNEDLQGFRNLAGSEV